MQTWEVLRALYKDPSKKFKLINDEDVILEAWDGREIDLSDIDWLLLTDKWEEIIEPVSFNWLLEEVKKDPTLTFRYSYSKLNYNFEGRLYRFLFDISRKFTSGHVAKILSEGEFYVVD